MITQIIKKFFHVFGLEIRRKIHAPLNNSIAYNSKENTDKFYSNPDLVAKYESPKRIAFYNTLITDIKSAVDFNSINTIADISAGTGMLLKILSSHNPEKKYVGYDFSEASIQLCKEKYPNIPFEVSNIFDAVTAKFDLVLCISTLEHLEYPEKAIQNMLTMLNPNGYLYVVVPNGRYDTFEGHIHYWSPESFKLFLEKLNCQLVSSKVLNESAEQVAVIQNK